MAYIKTIRIQNYQSHKDTILRLCPGINVFVGSTDVGKSSIMRALLWVATNSPRGEDFRSRWGGATKVKVVMSDRRSVERVRSDSENYYLVDGKDVYKAFGTEPPPAVFEVLQLSSTSFKAQHDSVFMLSETPTSLARMLNDIMGLALIDEAASRCNGLRVRKNEEGKVLARDIGDLSKRAASLKRMIKAKEALDSIKEDEAKLTAASMRLAELRSLATDLSGVLKGIKASTYVKEYDPIIDGLRERVAILDGQRRRLFTLENTIAQLAATSGAIKNSPDPEDLSKDVQAVSADLELLSSLIEKCDRLTNMVTSASNVSVKMKEKEKEAESISEDLNKEFPDQCPLCGSPVGERTW